MKFTREQLYILAALLLFAMPFGYYGFDVDEGERLAYASTILVAYGLGIVTQACIRFLRDARAGRDPEV